MSENYFSRFFSLNLKIFKNLSNKVIFQLLQLYYAYINLCLSYIFTSINYFMVIIVF